MVDLIKAFDEFDRTAPAENPVDVDATLADFLEFLAGKGMIDAEEGDWYAFGEEKGLSDEQIASLIEDSAGWLTPGGAMSQRAANWATSDPNRGPRPNPEEEEPGEEDEDDPDVEYCDCEDECEKHEQCPDCGFCIKCCCECEDEE